MREVVAEPIEGLQVELAASNPGSAELGHHVLGHARGEDDGGVLVVDSDATDVAA